jgi:hypothetical protein
LFLARIDFASAWIVSGAAFALYIGQSISRIQFANSPQLGVVIGYAISGIGTLIFAVVANLIAHAIVQKIPTRKQQRDNCPKKVSHLLGPTF